MGFLQATESLQNHLLLLTTEVFSLPTVGGPLFSEFLRCKYRGKLCIDISGISRWEIETFALGIWEQPYQAFRVNQPLST